MRFLVLALALAGLAMPGVGSARDGSLCTSICARDKQQCRAAVPASVDLDRRGFIQPEEKNPMARSASIGQVRGPDERLRERSEIASLTSERRGACDAAYLRCTRGCAASAGSAASGATGDATPSDVLRKPGESGAPADPAAR